MILRFLGTGGGRFVMTRQIRRTGGFVLEYGNTFVHVDPGPGALVLLNELYPPLRLSGVLVSHNHTDHINDAAVLIEGMTGGGRRKKGVLVGSSNVFEYSERYSPISEYHRSLPKDAFPVKPGDSFRIGDLKITATPTKHDEETGVGFLFEGDSTIAYLSDTGYREDLKDYLEDAHVLIFNLISPMMEDVPHTTLFAVRKILSEVRPKVVLLQHFGARILFNNLQSELARKIEGEFGVKTLALKDGDVFVYPKEKKITDFFTR